MRKMKLKNLAGVLLSTAIASTATAPFALFHFQQIATYGLVTNLLAVPLTALWIMPWGLAAYLLMPLGLEALALVPMGWGIFLLLAIAEAAAGWPNAVLRLASPPGWALGNIAIGGLWLWSCASQMRSRPLLPLGEPEVRERLEAAEAEA